VAAAVEYLHDEEQFLCLSGRFLLSRRPHGLGTLHPAETPAPLAHPGGHRRPGRPG